MPIHENHCPKCDLDFETITLSFSAPIDRSCPECREIAEARFGVPHIKTDQNIFRGAKYGGGQFDDDPAVGVQYMAEAKRAGVSVSGKTYQHGLASFPGDPSAWVSDVGEAKKKLKQKGWGAPGLGIKGRQVEPERIAVGEDILDRAVRQQIREGKIEAKNAEKERGAVADMICPRNAIGKYKRPQKKTRTKK